MFTLEKPSNDESHPDYIPSVFPTKKTNQLANSKKIDRNNSAKRCTSSNLENSSNNVTLTSISDQPSDVKPEPVFIGPKKIENMAGPDPINFSSYCSVSYYAVGTDAFELVSPTISLSESAAAAHRLTMFETPIKPDIHSTHQVPQLYETNHY